MTLEPTAAGLYLPVLWCGLGWAFALWSHACSPQQDTEMSLHITAFLVRLLKSGRGRRTPSVYPVLLRIQGFRGGIVGRTPTDEGALKTVPVDEETIVHVA